MKAQRVSLSIMPGGRPAGWLQVVNESDEPDETGANPRANPPRFQFLLIFSRSAALPASAAECNRNFGDVAA